MTDKSWEESKTLRQGVQAPGVVNHCSETSYLNVKGNCRMYTYQNKKASHQPTNLLKVGFYQRKTLQTSTHCGQAATAWPSVMALLVFHSDTTAGSTRLLDLQGDQNIEYDTAVASLAPSTAAERLPPFPPRPLSRSHARKKGKRRKNKPPP